MTADAAHGACVVATQAYTLKTLTVRDDAFIVVQAGAKVLHAPDAALAVGPGQGVMLARGTQWDVTNDPRGRREYSALVLGFPDAILRDFQALEGTAAVPAVLSSAPSLTLKPCTESSSKSRKAGRDLISAYHSLTVGNCSHGTSPR